MTFTTDQEELGRYARQWLDSHPALDRLRTLPTDPFEPAEWAEMAAMGWLGIAIPEAYGGAGYGFTELAVLGEEMGRALHPSAFLPTVILAASLLADLAERGGGDDGPGAVLEAIGAGSANVAVAHGETGRPWATGDFTTVGHMVNGGWELTGDKCFVIAAPPFDMLIVAATTTGGTSLFMVDVPTPGLTVTPLSVLDTSRPLVDVSLDSVPARPIVLDDELAGTALRRMVDRAVAFTAMEQVGGAQACLDMAVGYAKTRHQFGRPIGSFQAIKHMCAEMLVAVEDARSIAYHLASVVDSDPDETRVAVAMAHSACSDAFFRCAADNIQIHGGIGFTWEHDGHFYFKRAKSSSLTFGRPLEHRRHLADTLGI